MACKTFPTEKGYYEFSPKEIVKDFPETETKEKFKDPAEYPRPQNIITRHSILEEYFLKKFAVEYLIKYQRSMAKDSSLHLTTEYMCNYGNRSDHAAGSGNY